MAEETARLSRQDGSVFAAFGASHLVPTLDSLAKGIQNLLQDLGYTVTKL